MNQKQIALLIALATVCVNTVFAFTGITANVSCEVKQVATQLQATAYAAFSTTNNP